VPKFLLSSFAGDAATALVEATVGKTMALGVTRRLFGTIALTVSDIRAGKAVTQASP